MVAGALAASPADHSGDSADMVAPADRQGQGAAHQWNDEGERCVKCGAKDWMAGDCSPRTDRQAQGVQYAKTAPS
jgi:hypothetical protein